MKYGIEINWGFKDEFPGPNDYYRHWGYEYTSMRRCLQAIKELNKIYKAYIVHMRPRHIY